MRTFTALVVDDEQEIIVDAEATFLHSAHIKIMTASTLDKARELIATNFFHAAFVDLQLDIRNPRQSGGLTILRELLETRPACKRYLLTQHADKYRQDFFTLLNPLNPIIHGALDKQDFGSHFADVLRKLADQWMEFPVAVEGCQELFDGLRSKGVGNEDPLLTIDEIDYLTSSIVGQGRRPSAQGKEELNQLKLTLLGKGRSRSVVALGRPSNIDGIYGIYCVVKLGLRKESEEEFVRYNRHVRLLVSLNRRVELLDYVPGDCLAAVCYSFAGKSPGRIGSLAELFDLEDFRALRVIEELFQPSTKEWYAIERQERDMASYFFENYSLNATDVLDEVVRFSEQIAHKLNGSKIGISIHVEGDSINLPVGEMGHLRQRYRACVIHGDLNADNVIIADDDRVICIDYRYTGWGPQTLDFASLQASLRISRPVLDRDHLQIVKDHRIEKQVWDAAWRDNGTRKSSSFDRWPYWAQLCYTLLTQLRATFPEIREQEHAATCMLLALRLFRVRSLGEKARLRFLVWMSSLARVINNPR